MTLLYKDKYTIQAQNWSLDAIEAYFRSAPSITQLDRAMFALGYLLESSFEEPQLQRLTKLILATIDEQVSSR